MLSKRMIVIFSILLVLVVMIVLASTLFNLKAVHVKIKQNGTEDVIEKQVTDALEKYKGKNLLFLSEKEIAETVKGTSSYIDTVIVEKIFPTSMNIHITKRAELFSIKLEERIGVQKYYMLDINGYILRIGDSKTDNTPDLQRNIAIEGVVETDIVTKKVGERIIFKDIAKLNCITQIFTTLQNLEEPYSYTNSELKAFITSINISNIRKVMLSTYTGVKIELNDGEQNIENKVRLMIGTYNGLSEVEKTTGKIKIYDTKSNELGCDAVYE